MNAVNTTLGWLRRRMPARSTGLFRKSLWGFGDQALISATNFVTMVLLARVLDPHEFGSFTLAYTGLLFINSVQSALIVQPHTVLGATRNGSDFVRYTTATAWNQVILALVTALVIGGVAVVAAGEGWQIAPILFAIALATAAWQLQEFVRRVLYTKAHADQAFRNDIVSYGGQVVAVVVLWRAELLTPVTAVVALALTSALGFVFGVWQIRCYLTRSLSWPWRRETAAANWHFGKWLLGGNLAFWTSGQVYPLLAAGFINVTATGALRAIQTLMGPTNVLMSALDPLFGPKAAEKYASGGDPALRLFVRRIQGLMAITVGGYCVAVAIFAEPILRLVYGQQYSRYRWLLVLTALVYAFGAVRAPLTIAVKAMGKTRAIFLTYLASTLANLTLGVAAVHAYGLAGVGFGLVLNALVVNGVMWYFYLNASGSPIALGSLLERVRPDSSGNLRQRSIR